LDKTGEFSLFGGVKGTDGNAVFEEACGFGERFALEGAVDGNRAYEQI
jgi:hypothetical protein